MTRKLYPTDTLEQAQNVLGGWNQIDRGASVGALTAEVFETSIETVITLETEMANLEAQLTDKRNKRDALYLDLWDKVKRVRSGIKGIYGDDSSQYEMVGGTRVSERKSPTRKAVSA